MRNRLRLSLAVLLSLLLLLTGLPVCADTAFTEDPDAIEQTALSVLKLCIYDRDRSLIATGSGFIAFDNRTLVTNYHVIENAFYVEAESDDGYEYTVSKVLTADKSKDLAILHLKTPTVMQPLQLETDMSSVKRGSACVAIGSPKGLKNTVSLGNVSSVYTDEDGVSTVQFTAPISPGSSGGALFSGSGKVIGITSSTLDAAYAQNINFAVSAEEILALYAGWDGQEHELGGGYAAAPANSSSPEPDGSSDTDDGTVIETLFLGALEDESAKECLATDSDRCFFAVLAMLDWSYHGDNVDRYTYDFTQPIYVGRAENVVVAAFAVKENSTRRSEYEVLMHAPGLDQATYMSLDLDGEFVKYVIESVCPDGMYTLSSSSVSDTMDLVIDTVKEWLDS